jgi:hypothetical protein
MTITRDDLKKWKVRGTLFLDSEDSYSNHYVFDEEPRLTYVDSGPAGQTNSKIKIKHERKFFVDGIHCPDIDAVLTILNATEGGQDVSEYLCSSCAEDGMVCVPRVQHEALMAAVEAHERIVQHDPKTPGLHYPSLEALLESAIGHSRQALAALRAAGIQIEDQP